MNRDLKINVVCEGQIPLVKTLGEIWRLIAKDRGDDSADLVGLRLDAGQAVAYRKGDAILHFIPMVQS